MVSKAQSALEYMTTYGWAIMITLLAIAVLFYLGVINPKIVLPSTCVFPADLSCVGFALDAGGNLTLDLSQATGHPIEVTRLRCTQERDPVLNESDALPQPVEIADGAHALVSNRTSMCYRSDGTVYTGRPGDQYKGKIFIAYRELDTNFTHIVAADVSLKLEEAGG